MGGLRPRRWRRTAPSRAGVLYEGPECVGLERAALRLSLPRRPAEARIGRDAPALGEAAVAAAFAAARDLAGAGPVVLAGHSYGARRTLECLAQRSLPAAGALLLAYPFAPPKRASQAPLPHPSGALPCGFVSGERDSHAPPGTLEAALADRPNAQLLANSPG